MSDYAAFLRDEEKIKELKKWSDFGITEAGEYNIELFATAGGSGGGSIRNNVRFEIIRMKG